MSTCPSCGTSPAYHRSLADPWDTHDVCAQCGHCFTHGHLNITQRRRDRLELAWRYAHQAQTTAGAEAEIATALDPKEPTP